MNWDGRSLRGPSRPHTPEDGNQPSDGNQRPHALKEDETPLPAADGVNGVAVQSESPDPQDAGRGDGR